MIIKKKRLTKLHKDGYETSMKEEKNSSNFKSYKTSYQSFKTNTFSKKESDLDKSTILKSAGVGLGIGIGTNKLLNRIKPPAGLTDDEKTLRKLREDWIKRDNSEGTMFKDFWEEGKTKDKELKAIEQKIKDVKEHIKTKGVPFRKGNKIVAGILGTAAGGTAYYLLSKHKKNKNGGENLSDKDKEILELLEESSKKVENKTLSPKFHKIQNDGEISNGDEEKDSFVRQDKDKSKFSFNFKKLDNEEFREGLGQLKDSFVIPVNGFIKNKLNNAISGFRRKLDDGRINDNEAK